MRPIRIAIIGRMTGGEEAEVSRMAEAFQRLELSQGDIIRWERFGRPADVGETRMTGWDFIYLAEPFELREVIDAWKGKYDGVVRGYFGVLWREVNKRVARRIDGELCVPCRVLRGELKPSSTEHHLIYGEIVDDLFTNLMTVCDSIPRGPAVCHGYFHAKKVDHTLEILEGLKAKAERPADFRWETALTYYRARKYEG